MADSFLQALEKNIAASEKIVGATLLEAVHNLEVLASKVIGDIITHKDPTERAKELHATVTELKAAATDAAHAAATAAASAATAASGDLRAVEVAEAGVVLKDLTHPQSIPDDIVKTAEASNLGVDVANVLTTAAQAAATAFEADTAADIK